jgi:hypothetical protein
VTVPAPRLSTRGLAGYTYAEAFLALGPQSIGVTGENTVQDIIGRVWALVLTREQRLELYQRDAAAPTWQRVTALLPPLFAQTQPADRRRYSLAFDQSARVTVAYEDTSDGNVRVTRWDPSANAYVQNVTFAGRDPCLQFDAVWAFDIPQSDVLIFYLSTDRTKLMCRVQRDLYAVAYELHDYAQPVVLDRVVRLPLRYQVLASDANGDPLEDAGERVALVSALYPYLGTDTTTALVAPPTDGAYVQVIIPTEGGDAMLASMTSGPTSGLYAFPLIEYEDGDAMLASMTSGPTAGAYLLPIIFTEGDDAATGTLTSAPTSGLYELVVVETTGSDEATATLASGPTGGTYATP